MATKNAMTIPQKKRKVKRKARAQRKKATSVTLKRRGKKSHLAKKKKRKPIASNRVKKRPTRAQLERQLQAAEKKIRRLSGKKSRSQAAKKGWETRRRKRAEKAEIAIKETDLLEGVVFSDVTQERLEFLRRPEVRRQINELYIQKIPEFFVQGEEWVQQREPSILRRLIYAEVEGEFDEVAHEVAEEYGYEPNEIYSLWWGYKLQD